MQNKELVVDALVPYLEMNAIPFEKTYCMKQVHGNRVVQVGAETDQLVDEVDGLVTDKKDVFLAAFTADCMPVMLYDRKSEIVGIAHAGYKGLLAGIIDSVCEHMKKLGSDPKNIEVTIGPSIKECCYTVDSDRSRRFIRQFGHEESIIRYNGDRIFLNLQEVCAINLMRNGLYKESIAASRVCTSCNMDEYFSYRQDSKETFGHMVSVIGMSA